jgi:Uma2 family endonuclease
MPTSRPRPLLEIAYYEAAQAYLKSLPPEHFMEACPQGVQREITLESLAVIRRARPDVHYYNELLVQYRLRPDAKIRQVVPDNLVVRHQGELTVEGSYDVELQPARPFWTLEYVSKSNKRKDYDENFDRYEKELKVPYYLLFYPDHEELTLYRRSRSKYGSVKPDADGRLSIEEIETQVGLVGHWVRFWFRGNLVPLPAELQGQVEDLTRKLTQQAETIAQKDETIAQKNAEIARLLAILKDRSA